MYDLTISSSLLTKIDHHAAACRPQECCGLLVGSLEGTSAAIREVIPTDNVHGGDRRTAFAIDPVALAASLLGGRAAQHRLLGFFHSHPDRAPVPSRRDEDLAWPDFSYLILGSEPGGSWRVRSWRWLGTGRELAEEKLRVVAETELP